MSPYAVLADGRLAVAHGTGGTRLGVLDPGTGAAHRLRPAVRRVRAGLSASGQTVAAIAGGPTVPMTRDRRRRPGRGGTAAVRCARLSRSADSLPDAAYLPVPRAARLTGPSGSVVHALVYPPSNPAVEAPGRRAAAVHRLGARRPHVAGRPPARPGEGVLHQPRHRDHRRELRRVERLRPRLPGAAARPVGHRRRGRRDDGRARAGRGGRGGREAARHPRRVGRRLDRAGRGDVRYRPGRRPRTGVRRAGSSRRRRPTSA